MPLLHGGLGIKCSSLRRKRDLKQLTSGEGGGVLPDAWRSCRPTISVTIRNASQQGYGLTAGWSGLKQPNTQTPHSGLGQESKQGYGLTAGWSRTETTKYTNTSQRNGARVKARLRPDCRLIRTETTKYTNTSQRKSCSLSQELSWISWNPNVRSSFHKRSQLTLILGHINPVHKKSSHLFKIHFNIILSTAPPLSISSLSFMLPTKNTYALFSSIHATCPAIPSSLWPF